MNPLSNHRQKKKTLELSFQFNILSVSQKTLVLFKTNSTENYQRNKYFFYRFKLEICGHLN